MNGLFHWAGSEEISRFDLGLLILKRFGMLVLYGPFLDGKKSENSNLRFDEKLKSKNSCWGVREINDICNISGVYGFELFETINMPSNNKILIFKKL